MKGTVKIIFQVVDGTTEKLSVKEEGEYIQDFSGPLGMPTHTDGIRKVCIIGGGVGCAIALPVAEEFHKLEAEVTGAATVISAMGAGKTAAHAIDEYLSNK